MALAMRGNHRAARFFAACFGLAMTVASANAPEESSGAGTPMVGELHFVLTVVARQDWSKQDPSFPDAQWSKATSQQRYEVTVRLRSDGQRWSRNLLDDDLAAQLEAKTLHLAHEAITAGLTIPRTETERRAFGQHYRSELARCGDDDTCSRDVDRRYASILAALQYPPEDLIEPPGRGRYFYFEPYSGCRGSTQVSVQLDIHGERINRLQHRLVPFSERHAADRVGDTEGEIPCAHFLAVVDPSDPARGFQLENAFIPTPVGRTEYTEDGHTERQDDAAQPVPGPVFDWVTATLHHAPSRGRAETTMALTAPLNSDATLLGNWTGTANAHLEWSFSTHPTETPQ